MVVSRRCTSAPAGQASRRCASCARTSGAELPPQRRGALIDSPGAPAPNEFARRSLVRRRAERGRPVEASVEQPIASTPRRARRVLDPRERGIRREMVKGRRSARRARRVAAHLVVPAPQLEHLLARALLRELVRRHTQLVDLLAHLVGGHGAAPRRRRLVFDARRKRAPLLRARHGLRVGRRRLVPRISLREARVRRAHISRESGER